MGSRLHLQIFFRPKPFAAQSWEFNDQNPKEFYREVHPFHMSSINHLLYFLARYQLLWQYFTVIPVNHSLWQAHTLTGPESTAWNDSVKSKCWCRTLCLIGAAAQRLACCQRARGVCTLSWHPPHKQVLWLNNRVVGDHHMGKKSAAENWKNKRKRKNALLILLRVRCAG